MTINLAAHGFDDVPAVLPGEFSKIPADGYVCKVCNAEITKSKAGNPMLVLFLDIAEGEFQWHFNYAIKRVKSFNPDFKWDSSAIYRQLIFDNNDKVSKFFKGLLFCFEKSNPKFSFNPNNFDAQILNGCNIGFIFAEEEYEKSDGSVATRIFPKFPKSVDDIRNKNFSVPELKKLVSRNKATANSNDTFSGENVDSSDLPF